MKRSSVVGLAASVVVGGLAWSALGVPAAFTENFDSMPLGAMVDTASLDVRNNGQITIISEASGNQCAQWNSGADTHLWVLGSDGGNYDGTLSFAIKCTAGINTGWNQLVQLNYQNELNANKNQAIGRTSTNGVSFGSNDMALTAPSITVADTDWLWIQVQKQTVDATNSQITLTASADSVFDATDPSTTQLVGFSGWGSGSLFSESGIRFKWQGGLMIDDVKFSAVPEPASLSLLGLGALGLLARRRRA